MSIIKNLTTETNLGVKVDQLIGAADTTLYLRFYDLITKEAREPATSNRTNLLVTLEKDGSRHEIMILGTVAAAVDNVSTCTNVIRDVAFDGLSFTAGTGKTHRVGADGGCANPAILFNQFYRVLSGELGTGANNFRAGDETASDISYYYQNDHSTKPRSYYDDSDKRIKLSWGDDAPAFGDIDGVGIPVLTEAERDAMNWPQHGPMIYNSTSGEHEKRMGGSWITVASGGTFPNASETVTGKVQLATDAQALAGTDTDGGDPLVVKPSQILSLISSGSLNYAVDSVGTDSYAISLPTTLTSYVDGLPVDFEAGTACTGPSTLNIDSLGAIPIKTGDYIDTITGDILEDQKIIGLVSVKAVTFTAVFTGGETSGTLTANWGYKTGTYSVEFSNGDRRDVTLTKGATTASWSGGLSGAATASAEAQWYQMMSMTNNLSGGSDASESHYHDLLKNSALLQRFEYRISDGKVTTAGSSANNGGSISVVSAAVANSLTEVRLSVFNKDGSTFTSVHDKNPHFRVHVAYAAATAQDGFIGFVDKNFVGTSLENGAMTLDHFGFIIIDGTPYISAADGTTQESIVDISATVTDITNGYTYEGTFDGTTATLKINGTTVGTFNTNVPDDNLSAFVIAVLPDATAAAKQFQTSYAGRVSVDET